MATAYLRDLGVENADRVTAIAVRLIERLERRETAPREEVMLTAFAELQRLIGEETDARSHTQGDLAEVTGRLALWLATRPAAAPEPAVPLASPAAPERTAMAPQPLETWFERARADGRRLLTALLGAGGRQQATVTIRIDA